MPDVILKNLPFLLHGLWLTVELSAWSIVLGTLLGLLVGTIRFVRVPVLNVLAAIYVEFIRGTPLLVVLFITYFALPALFGYRTTAYRAAIFGFVLFIAAYLAEDFRAGLRAVRPTLIQAGLATGLTRWQVLRHIILPQAIRRVLPSLFNQYVRLIKFTSVASVIGVTELTGAGLLINARDFHPVKILATIAIVYLVVCSALSLAGRALYAQFGVRT
ncbi:MAG TPA: amino acid ABC transporter permease [Bradyrhizobium sp.]|jgi:His/Glu/Gln/Arg/opine family amino acid ABC transporter permease subunit|nr:amino acid ABC transporter permease [Bradyrhizobium sp.]